MRIEGKFEAPGSPDIVMDRLTDVERMARCLPGASIEGRADDGQYLGAITVALGPKKMIFRGQVACEFDRDARQGVLVGKASSNVRGSNFSSRTTFDVREAGVSRPEKPVSLVELVSEAQLSGVLAEFAKTGGTILANALIAEFARNLAVDLADVSPAVAGGKTPEAPNSDNGRTGSGGGAQLSVVRIGWLIIKAQLLRLYNWVVPGSRKGAD